MVTEAKKYQRAKIRLFFIELALVCACFLVFQFSGISHLAKLYSSQFLKTQALVIIGYLFIFGAFYYLVSFPIKFYGGFLLEHKYNLSNQSFLSWLKDEGKEVIVSSIIVLIFVELLYFLLREAPFSWWLWMAIVWFLFSMFFTRVFPTMILPLFYKYKELNNVALKQALIDLAKRSGVRIIDIFQIDFSRKTKKANAALIGLGKTKRIILADNLLSNYTESEIKAVLAHELGHYKRLHMWKLLVFGAIITLSSFYIIYCLANHLVKFLGVAGISDIEAFPALSLILVLFSFVTLPIYNAYSRRLERAADLFALQATRDKEAFISCMEKLARQNLSDTSPSRIVEILFYDHPPISKRIGFAQREMP